MRYRQILFAIPLASLCSCASPMGAGRTPSCDQMKGYVYSGSPNGYVLVLSFRDQALPGFKHNVQIVPPSGPMFDPLDGECKDDAVTVYKPGQPASPNTRDAVWTLSDPQVNGAAFHLHDPGSVLFPHGLDGDLHQQ